MASILKFDEWQNGSGNKMHSVIQVKRVTTNTRLSVASQDLTAIPGMSISITPRYVGSMLLLQAQISGSSQHVTTYGFLKNSSPVSTITNTNSTGSILTVYDGQDTNDYMYGQFFDWSELSQSTGTLTFDVGVSASWSGGVRTAYINNRVSNDMASISTFTIWEIAQ